MRKPMWAFLGMLVLAMTLLVACAGGDDDAIGVTGEGESTGSTMAVVAPEDGRDGGGGTSANADDLGKSDASPSGVTVDSSVAESYAAGVDGVISVALQQVGDGRVVIYTSSMVVVVEDVALATRQAQTAMAGLGGLVFGQDTTTEPFPRTVLTFKVLPDDFQEALGRLAELGKLESQQVSTDDVTERVVDLESRIITAEASVERLREFLRNTTDLEGVAQLEAQLLQRETDLELLRGQLRTVREQAALATIFLTLIEPAPDALEARVELVQTAYLDADEGERCPGDDELSVDEGDSITVCVEIENTGNLALTEIEVRDTGLDLDEKDFVVLEGSLAGPLEPGDRLIGYFETTAELHQLPSPRFSAVVIDEDGKPIRTPVEVEAEVVDLEVIADTSVPSFVDGLTGSLGAVKVIGQMTLLAAGVAIPFFWLPLLALAVVWGIRRMSVRRDPRAASVVAVSTEGDGGLE